MTPEHPSILELFYGLGIPPCTESRNLYTAVEIPQYGHCHLGRDAQGAPALLIKWESGQARSSPPPIRLQHLFVAHSLECEIHRQSIVESGLFTVVSCIDADWPLETYFLRILQALLPIIGDNPSPKTINAAVDKLVELFQVLRNPPKKTAQGLWAELLVIAESSNVTALIDAWHSVPEDLYDFNSGKCRVEVKSVSGQVRRHHFSLAQLLPPNGTELVVASVIVNRAGAGETIIGLVEEISSKLTSTPERILRLHQMISLTLGDGWRQSTLEAFDRQVACQSLSFFDLSQIPTISPELPQGVSNVHFTADLVGKSSLSNEELKKYGGIISVLKSTGKQGLSK
jgi:hypothetical protein